MKRKNVGAWKKAVSEYFEMTTIGALPQAYFSHYLSLKLIWLVVFMGGLTMTIIHMQHVISLYLNYPIKVQVFMKSNESLEFPAVTVCNLNPVKKSQIRCGKYQALVAIQEKFKRLPIFKKYGGYERISEIINVVLDYNDCKKPKNDTNGTSPSPDPLQNYSTTPSNGTQVKRKKRDLESAAKLHKRLKRQVEPTTKDYYGDYYTDYNYDNTYNNTDNNFTDYSYENTDNNSYTDYEVEYPTETSTEQVITDQPGNPMVSDGTTGYNYYEEEHSESSVPEVSTEKASKGPTVLTTEHYYNYYGDGETTESSTENVTADQPDQTLATDGTNTNSTNFGEGTSELSTENIPTMITDDMTDFVNTITGSPSTKKVTTEPLNVETSAESTDYNNYGGESTERSMVPDSTDDYSYYEEDSTAASMKSQDHTMANGESLSPVTKAPTENVTINQVSHTLATDTTSEFDYYGEPTTTESSSEKPTTQQADQMLTTDGTPDYEYYEEENSQSTVSQQQDVTTEKASHYGQEQTGGSGVTEPSSGQTMINDDTTEYDYFYNYVEETDSTVTKPTAGKVTGHTAGATEYVEVQTVLTSYKLSSLAAHGTTDYDYYGDDQTQSGSTQPSDPGQQLPSDRTTDYDYYGEQQTEPTTKKVTKQHGHAPSDNTYDYNYYAVTTERTQESDEGTTDHDYDYYGEQPTHSDVTTSPKVTVEPDYDEGTDYNYNEYGSSTDSSVSELAQKGTGHPLLSDGTTDYEYNGEEQTDLDVTKSPEVTGGTDYNYNEYEYQAQTDSSITEPAHQGMSNGGTTDYEYYADEPVDSSVTKSQKVTSDPNSGAETDYSYSEYEYQAQTDPGITEATHQGMSNGGTTDYEYYGDEPVDSSVTKSPKGTVKPDYSEATDYYYHENEDNQDSTVSELAKKITGHPLSNNETSDYDYYEEEQTDSSVTKPQKVTDVSDSYNYYDYESQTDSGVAEPSQEVTQQPNNGATDYDYYEGEEADSPEVTKGPQKVTKESDYDGVTDYKYNDDEDNSGVSETDQKVTRKQQISDDDTTDYYDNYENEDQTAFPVDNYTSGTNGPLQPDDDNGNDDDDYPDYPATPSTNQEADNSDDYNYKYDIDYYDSDDHNDYRTDNSWKEGVSHMDKDVEEVQSMDEEGEFFGEEMQRMAWMNSLGGGDDKYNFDKFLASSKLLDFKDIMELATFTDTDFKEYGYSYSDFIIECTIDRTKCNKTWFTRITSNKYGNCYTFNQATSNSTKLHIARRVGSQYGLRLTLNINYTEYIGLLAPEYGIRVSVHPTDTKPAPEDYGLDASPGMKTSVAVRRSEIKRLTTPYSTNCTNEFPKEYLPYISKTTTYSLDLCKTGCKDSFLHQKCGCVSKIQNPDKNPLNLKTCDIFNSSQRVCRLLVDTLFYLPSTSEKALKCHCQPKCDEVFYISSVSNTKWPSKAYQQLKVLNFPKHHASEMFLKTLVAEGLSQYYGEMVKEENRVEDNLVRLHIYYESLIYELVVESPQYPMSQLWADFGGVAGLYLGMTAATAIEAIQILFLIGYSFFASVRKNRKISKFELENIYEDQNASATSIPPTVQ